jgi:DNA repair protein RecN (Recombination protein N)
MLLELKVSNFATIDNVHISFRNGLNILSGETGTGKSILLKSLGLLMGEKASADSVRSGCENAIIEGSFDIAARPDIHEHLTNMGIDAADEQIVVRRIVSGTANKSRVYINGSLSTLSILRGIVAPLVEVTSQPAPLIEMTGQHENRNLMTRGYHLDLLDQFIGLWKSRNSFSELFQRQQLLQSEIEAIRQECRNRAQRLDFLLYQRDEIRSLDLRPGEEEEIEIETKRMKHSARLGKFAAQAEAMLYNDDDSVTSRLHYLLQRASELRNLDPALMTYLEPLSQAKTLISEASYELRNYTKSLEADPSRLEELESRLSRLRQLQKKYGLTAVEILAALSAIELEIHNLENSDEHLKAKQVECAKLEIQLQELAKEMHKLREHGAHQLAKGVNEELKELNMKGVTFQIHTEWAPEAHQSGQSLVEFMSQNSKTDHPRALGKAASGGELSRILLALKQVVGAGKFPRTYLFDEVDSGVSGPTAEKVGRKLHTIAKGQQVICVTHLPQVASFADAHFLIYMCNNTNKSGKISRKMGAQTEVLELSSGQRIEEIARLISGEKITKTSLAHAEQLLSDRH